MVQLVILGLLAVALAGSIWKVYDAGGDEREATLRTSLQAEKDRLTKEKQDHEKVMREFAQALTKGYLEFGRRQGKLAEGAKDAIREEIRNNPDLQRACLPATSVRDFNATGVGGRRGGSTTPGARDGVVPRATPSGTERKSP
jgi:hypothetical protein